MNNKPLTYKNAGVSIANGEALVDYLKQNNKAIGGFSGLFPIPTGYKKPMMVAGTDGVGTKILVARNVGVLSTVGIDLVAMVVNDLVVCGAKPLFFLDYYAMGELRLDEAKQILSGIIRGCEIGQMALLGGETAEMPGLYAKGDYDLAGFGVGIVDADAVIDGSRIAEGDVVYGFASTGLHSNGYSLARKVLLEHARLQLGDKPESLGGRTLSDVMLEPTRIYVSLMDELLKSGVDVRGCAHITGGGLPGNLNRCLPKNVDASLSKSSWDVPEIFTLIQTLGPVEDDEMLRTFNMGIGYCVVAPASAEQAVRTAADKSGNTMFVIGKIVSGEGNVRVEL
ncbi:phosphoribosylformylglycinamidine cyclo-ligase [Candidatus Sumerlaeota bacterium]|nr:phosphoribosylformylglycinamidine cyclo-ligase [Candidatus Sumerlaeales bacterium]NLD61853.1 phosphoribosylformylglycinamidine cyclo-ligase [Candidatus Sumerlaeota bacterium]